jgi:hypothetical protein
MPQFTQRLDPLADPIDLLHPPQVSSDFESHATRLGSSLGISAVGGVIG